MRIVSSDHLAPMLLTSPAFSHEGTIPSLYAADWENISPPLDISEVPEGVESFVLIVDDPDVPRDLRPDGLFLHWIVWDISPDTRSIETGAENLFGTIGANTRGGYRYAGPRPPDREHRYFFRLYALDVALGLPVDSPRDKVEQAMEWHVLAESVLMGRYAPQSPSHQ